MALVRGVIRRRDIRQVEVEADGADIGEHGRGADTADASARGEERERRRNHLVAGANSQAHQGEEDGVGAGGDPQGVADAEQLRHVSLEPIQFRAEDVVPGTQHPLKGVGEFAFEGEILGLEIEKWYGHRRKESGTPRGHLLRGHFVPVSSPLSIQRTYETSQ
jgi:hypothetical protein